MTSRYEQKINAIGETVGRIDERQIALSNRLYDKDGDIPKIVNHLDELNGAVRSNEEKILNQEVKMKGFPYNVFSKKWFWVIIVIIILSILGLSNSINIQELLIKVLG